MCMISRRRADFSRASPGTSPCSLLIIMFILIGFPDLLAESSIS
jgi:hypothetical protein